MFNARANGAWMIALGVLFLSGCGAGGDEEEAAHVGSQDCALLATVPGAAANLCDACQGIMCAPGSPPQCVVLPCVDEVYMAQGCDSDDDCAEFGLSCGLFTSVHKLLCGSDPGAR
jgi:hypothetical protein